MILSLLLSCASDVSIMKRYEEIDTSTSVPDTELVTTSDTAQTSPSDQQHVGITGYSYLHLRQVACPACVGETQEITITYEAQFHQPIGDSHTKWIPELGSCTDNMFGVSPSTIPQSIGSSISVANPEHGFSVPAMGQGFYWTDNIWETELQRDAVYSVSTEAGSYDFISTSGFDFIEPYTLLWIDPSYAFDAPIYRSGASFYWGPTKPGASFMVTIAVYTTDGSQMLGYVVCTGPDNGSLTVPGQYLQYPVGSITSVHLSRYRVDMMETDINNSHIESHVEWEVIGTGHIE